MRLHFLAKVLEERTIILIFKQFLYFLQTKKLLNFSIYLWHFFWIFLFVKVSILDNWFFFCVSNFLVVLFSIFCTNFYSNRSVCIGCEWMKIACDTGSSGVFMVLQCLVWILSVFPWRMRTTHQNNQESNVICILGVALMSFLLYGDQQRHI